MLAAAQFLHAPDHPEEAPLQALPARQGGELGASILGRVERSATVLCPECHLAFGGMDALKRHCTQDHDFTIVSLQVRSPVMCMGLEACLHVRTVGTLLETGPNCTDILRNTTAPSTGSFSRAGCRLTFGSLLEQASTPV